MRTDKDLCTWVKEGSVVIGDLSSPVNLSEDPSTSDETNPGLASGFPILVLANERCLLEPGKDMIIKQR